MADLSLDPTQLDRYSRHVVMDEVGPEGQAALLDGRVLVVGCGGLGSPVVQYLAAAGVGHLTLVDDDGVERSNLQRQVVHADADVGRPKVESARDYVERLNPDVSVAARETRVERGNAAALVADHDVVVDASDNFPTRYLLNDAARLAGVALAHGAIYRFEGQATTLVPDGPCYRCLFPEAPEPGSIPDCATTGVLGVLPGTVGALQATEAAKLLLGLGDPLVGRLLFYDAADATFETATYRARPDCPVCGDDPIDSLDEVAYEGGCAVSGS
jgi:adenylyltransferase/sulfurtransferase